MSPYRSPPFPFGGPPPPRRRWRPPPPVVVVVVAFGGLAPPPPPASSSASSLASSSRRRCRSMVEFTMSSFSSMSMMGEEKDSFPSSFSSSFSSSSSTSSRAPEDDDSSSTRHGNSRTTYERRRTGRTNGDGNDDHHDDVDPIAVSKVAIVGGGLAGLSTAYHLLEYSGGGGTGGGGKRRMHVTIFDRSNVGEGGASSVAGGLIHPFSPRGKLVHFGLAALDVASRLVDVASKHEPKSVLSKNLYRLALDEANRDQLFQTSIRHPALTSWLSENDVSEMLDVHSSFGGLAMSNGCGVIHVPTYLRGLLRACEVYATDLGGSVEWELVRMSPTSGGGERNTCQRGPPREEGDTTESYPSVICTSWDDVDTMNRRLDRYDAVILCAGAGILNDRLIGNECQLPVQLVRGQSIEMTLPTTPADGGNNLHEALLCGKYVSPLPSNITSDSSSSSTSSSRRFVIGATHEYKDEPLNANEVIDELKCRTYELARGLWDRGTIDGLTSGIRLQTHRGRFGRMPIVGRYRNVTEGSAVGVSHPNSWIFTGLSSRGLIYHGLFGSWLAKAVLHDDEEKLRDEFADFDWWRTTEAYK